MLELGTGYEGETCRSLVLSYGLDYVGTDTVPGAGVDVVADFENVDHLPRCAATAPFGAVLILNVLEHTFDPIRILDNATSPVGPGGHLVLLTPTVWPLHNSTAAVLRVP